MKLNVWRVGRVCVNTKNKLLGTTHCRDSHLTNYLVQNILQTIDIQLFK